MLYPINTESRTVIDLNGIWKFKLDDGKGLDNRWYETGLKGDVYSIPVPSSYNDLVEDHEFREHVGYIWYEKEVIVSDKMLQEERVVLRFSSATHIATVYIEGKEVMYHRGGFLPFEAEINDFLTSGVNRITVAIDNRLDTTTLPVGRVDKKEYATPYPSDLYKLEETVYRHSAWCVDFFNYSGIHRPVKIYTTPKNYINDITFITDIKGVDGIINYQVDVKGEGDVRLTVFDEENNELGAALGKQGKITIEEAKLWNPGDAYLYKVKVQLIQNSEVIDTYYENCGLRTVEVKDGKFLINSKPFYFKGFGKHEDSNQHGRGLDEVINIKDFNLMKWMGANSFRTSHYPYSEEIMRLADREGIVVIDEVAAVGLHLNFAPFMAGRKIPKEKLTWNLLGTQEQHMQDVTDLINRDKNHPCVVMWCLANESALDEEGCYDYFKPIMDLAKELDPQKRPLTIVSHILYDLNIEESHKVLAELDVLCFNRYNGWYIATNDVQLVKPVIVNELTKWWEHHKKPLMYTEFGADTVCGLRESNPVVFTEEYQKMFYEVHGEAFDECPYFIGEQVWNFADFATRYDSVMRVAGNKKGIFTRERKPKMAAYTLKERWTNIPDFEYKK